LQENDRAVAGSLSNQILNGVARTDGERAPLFWYAEQHRRTLET